MLGEYRFMSEWFVPDATPEEVYDVVGDAVGYPRWWGNVWLEVEGGEGAPRPGRRSRILAKGYLPYKLRWFAEVTEADRPRTFSIKAEGDFRGGGMWTFEPVEGGTKATLDWRPVVYKPLVRYLTPLLKPLFSSNHYWTMRRGQEQVTAEVERRRSEAAA
jgi:hypothetical protein